MSNALGHRTAIVFGGAGFIGGHLLAQLAASGRYDRLVSYDIAPAKAAAPKVEYIIGDVREPIVIPGHLDGADIYNLAAVHTTPGHQDWEYFWTNVNGAINICAFARAIGTRFMLFTSSISVYGPTEDAVDEAAPPAPVSAYGRSKLQAEGIHRTWREGADDRQLVVVRPAVIFGPGEGGNFTRLARLLSRGHFVYPGRRDTIKSCCYVGELVRSMEFARNLGRREFTYNMSYPARTTTEQICAAFAKVAGFNEPQLLVPWSLMKAGGLAFELLGAVGIKTSINRERIAKLIKSTNIIPNALMSEGYEFETTLSDALTQWSKRSGATFI
ncbi:NAD-dependent epimerase/dehydratase family protein [Rhodopseudomonas palustris]|uniref:NAD-dependent epimerase/dehydratase family protein n=1 Tax=Rhodopseudomonas palustris TaxID=1076 RepID=UPI0020CD9D26|nr:NAD-dependent epimerase/dehydratase family protein [Rhodopseudomonas palustris]MCP9626318.1 NAD-dependent epimerase/dehydratase family protein [Rhodopseudomonas palustris]